jgi:hypothetical protein
MFISFKQRVAAVAIVVAVIAGGVTALTAITATPPSNATAVGTGVDEFGMTAAYFGGRTLHVTYTNGFFCDTSVAAHSSSGCEAGEKYKRPPAPNFDPLYITVPLGFTVPMKMQHCPASLICVDHPGTVDLTRLEPTLKPLNPHLSDAQLTAALKNFAVPGHDHFITDTNDFQPEWWNVQVIGVTNPDTYASIQRHRSFEYVNRLLRRHDPAVAGPIPSNLFLFFAVNHHAHSRTAVTSGEADDQSTTRDPGVFTTRINQLEDR